MTRQKKLNNNNNLKKERKQVSLFYVAQLIGRLHNFNNQTTIFGG